MSNNSVAVRKTNRQSFGQTRDPLADGRRVFIANIPQNTTLEQIFSFFGPKENIEGVFIDFTYAQVTFKRPKDFSWALTKNGEKFEGRRIAVTPFKRQKQKPRRLSPARIVEETRRESRRLRLRSHSRSPRRRSRSRSPRRRSRSRSRSRSIDRYHDSRSRSQPNDSFLRPSRLQIDPKAISTAFSNYSLEYREQQQQQQPNERLINHSWGTTVQSFSSTSMPSAGDLPSDIDLTLKLVISQQTARNLSISQIQNVMNYFEAQLRALQGRSVIIPPSNIQYMQQPQQMFPPAQPQSAIITPHNCQSLSAMDTDHVIEPEPEPPLAITATEESMGETLRLIRELHRSKH